ncbi:hypothetical protein LEMLEM_LOCUS25287, partial [Lemmus lemmus]
SGFHSWVSCDLLSHLVISLVPRLTGSPAPPNKGWDPGPGCSTTAHIPSARLLNSAHDTSTVASHQVQPASWTVPQS